MIASPVEGTYLAVANTMWGRAARTEPGVAGPGTSSRLRMNRDPLRSLLVSGLVLVTSASAMAATDRVLSRESALQTTRSLLERSMDASGVPEGPDREHAIARFL